MCGGGFQPLSGQYETALRPFFRRRDQQHPADAVHLAARRRPASGRECRLRKRIQPQQHVVSPVEYFYRVPASLQFHVATGAEYSRRGLFCRRGRSEDDRRRRSRVTCRLSVRLYQRGGAARPGVCARRVADSAARNAVQIAGASRTRNHAAGTADEDRPVGKGRGRRARPVSRPFAQLAGTARRRPAGACARFRNVGGGGRSDPEVPAVRQRSGVVRHEHGGGPGLCRLPAGSENRLPRYRIRASQGGGDGYLFRGEPIRPSGCVRGRFSR